VHFVGLFFVFIIENARSKKQNRNKLLISQGCHSYVTDTQDKMQNYNKSRDLSFHTIFYSGSNWWWPFRPIHVVQL